MAVTDFVLCVFASYPQLNILAFGIFAGSIFSSCSHLTLFLAVHVVSWEPLRPCTATISTIGFSPSTNKLRPRGRVFFDDVFEFSSLLFDDGDASLLVDSLKGQTEEKDDSSSAYHN